MTPGEAALMNAPWTSTPLSAALRLAVSVCDFAQVLVLDRAVAEWRLGLLHPGAF